MFIIQNCGNCGKNVQTKINKDILYDIFRQFLWITTVENIFLAKIPLSFFVFKLQLIYKKPG